MRGIILVCATIGFILASAFNACSKEVTFSSSESSQGSLGIDENEIQNVVDNCASLASAGQLHTHQQQIIFNDSKQETGRNEVCQFGQGHNLAKRDGYLQAEYTQKRDLTLPANAVICDMRFSSPQQSLVYDDMFYLQFNGYVIASNHQRSMGNLQVEPIDILGQSISLTKFEWLNVREESFTNAHVDYCLGQDKGLSSCHWPQTQQTGTLSLSFSNQLMIHLGLRAPASQQFALTVTGDNDPSSDCYHSEIKFNVEVKYFTR